MSEPSSAVRPGDPTVPGTPGSTPTTPRSRVPRVAGRWALRGAVALVGALLAILLLARIEAPLGPFDATFAFRPTGGDVQLEIPPLGALDVDAYDGPLGLDVTLQRVDEARIRALVTSPWLLDDLVDRVNADLEDAVTRLAWRTAGAAVGGAVLLSLLVYRRRWREPAIAAGLTVGLLGATGGLGAATWRPEALAQPTYTGLLVNANSLIGSAEDIMTRFDAYRASLEDLVGNVSNLYATLSALPDPGGTPDTVALLHISDLHLNPAGFDLVRQVVDQFAVDGVLDTGDITDWGSEPENRLIASVGRLGVPYVFIRGNHDSAATAALVAAQPNATVLDDTAVTVAGVTVVGTRDPRFTPDPAEDVGAVSLEQSGEGLAEVAEALPDPPAIALVHDPVQATPLDGVVPLVLAGHTHERAVETLDEGTTLMVQGSTGGAGLRALQGEYPEPLTCTVLYIDPDTGTLTAYDDITLGGLGETEVTIVRTLIEPPGEDPPAGSGDGTSPPGPSTAPTSPGS